MNSKFSKEELLKAADSGLSDLSCAQIKELIRKESDKDFENMNTDFIDLCFNVLSMKQKAMTSDINDTVIKPRKLTVRKALLFAAIFVVLMLTVLTVSAQFFNFNIPKEIAILIQDNDEMGLDLGLADTSAYGYALVES